MHFKCDVLFIPGKAFAKAIEHLLAGFNLVADSLPAFVKKIYVWFLAFQLFLFLVIVRIDFMMICVALVVFKLQGDSSIFQTNISMESHLQYCHTVAL